MSSDGVEHWIVRIIYQYNQVTNQSIFNDPIIQIWIDWCEEQFGRARIHWGYFKYEFDFRIKNDYTLFLLTWDE